MGVESLVSFPSPIHPDLEKIGMHLWNQFFSANLDDDLSNSPDFSSVSCFPSQEVEDYLTEAQSLTPLFYESNRD
jgi:hypothetical protein